MNLKHISLTVENHIGKITISNPPTLNALNSLIIKELEQVIEVVAASSDIYVLIITGDGRSFVAGADISEMVNLNSDLGKAFGETGSAVFRKIELLEKPVIAAVNGFALGGGCELALSCDIRVASENAKFAQPEVGLGICPGFSGTVRMAKLLGPGKAKELIFTGRVIGAAEALEIGLVNCVVKQEEIMDKAMEMANMIATKAPIAIKYSKEAINNAMDLDSEKSIEMENILFGKCFSTKDQKEGMTAFLAKQKPLFTNK
ncbi:MAG TPA: crotonase [Rikenellaceae bacterium]|nr:crotonase [Rikenellaceae bacterium]